jgi:hypothetical protein
VAALALAKNREVQYGVTLALAMSGASSQAQTLANDLESSFPEDTSVKFNHLPAVRAFLALNYGDPAKAVELLQVATPYELGTPRSSQQGSSEPSIRSMCVTSRIWPPAKVPSPR